MVMLSLRAITDKLGGEICGDPELKVFGLSTLQSAKQTDISFLDNPKYRSQLVASQAACVIVDSEMKSLAQKRGACIVVPQPYVYFARLSQYWKSIRASSHPPFGVHVTAVVDAGASVDSSAYIGPLCVIEKGARIGSETILKSGVTVGENCSIGSNCILHPGVVIGSDGFGFALDEGNWIKIEQMGAVRIGDHVEIGANTCIDRGSLGDTVIEDGVKLDNLIQIGHNVRVGAHTAMAGCVGVAGSANIGAHCTIGGGAVVLGHLTLVDGVHISAATVVTKSVLRPGHFTGIFPLDDNASWAKNAASLKQLSRLRTQIKSIEKNMKNKS